MTALPRRPLGRAPLTVSALGFGAAPLGGLYREVPAADAGTAVQAALAAGVTYFDTAPLYGHGLSEHRLGEALREVPRDTFVLSTKVGRLLRPARGAQPSDGLFANALPFDYVYDYSRDGTRRSLEDSLQRLGLARVDIALIHDVVPYPLPQCGARGSPTVSSNSCLRPNGQREAERRFVFPASVGRTSP
jgi:D-threo-aldose 1-dehydrogenase